MEKVDYYLEQMLPELHDLKEKKLFTQDEIREVIKRRTAFERALIRRVARKQDFTRYAEYELNLEELRKRRLARLKNPSMKPSISSYSLVRRILHIFDRATKKFKGDVGLWIQYAEIAKKQNARKLVGKILAAAVTQHPLSPTLYILLSSHELSENLAPQAARTVLQRGLRLLPLSAPLWTEYAKMELVWVERLRRRWSVLGVAQDSTDHSQDYKAIDGPESTAEGRKAIMDGAVVRAVWEGANKSIPDSLQLHASFLKLYRSFPTPLRAKLLAGIYESLEGSGVLGKKAESRRLLAMKGFEDAPYPELEGREKGQELEGVELVDALKAMVGEFKKGLGVVEEVREREELMAEFSIALRGWESKIEDEGLKQYLAYHLSQLLLPPNTLPVVHVLHLHHLLSLPPSTGVSSPSKIVKAARTSHKLFPSSPAVTACRLTAELRYSPEGNSGSSEELDALFSAATSLGLQSIPDEDEAGGLEREGWEKLWEVWFLYLSGLDGQVQERAIHQLLQRSLRTPKSSTSTSKVSASSVASSSLPIHTHLLISSLPLLHPHASPPAPSQRLQTFAKIRTSYLPTSDFYNFAFMHESLLPSSRPVLEQIYNSWRASFGDERSLSGMGGEKVREERAADLVEAHLTWLRWLKGEGDSRGVREVLRRFGEDGVDAIGERVREGWRLVLEEAEEAGGEEEEEDASMEDTEMMVEDDI